MRYNFSEISNFKIRYFDLRIRNARVAQAIDSIQLDFVKMKISLEEFWNVSLARLVLKMHLEFKHIHICTVIEFISLERKIISKLIAHLTQMTLDNCGGSKLLRIFPYSH